MDKNTFLAIILSVIVIIGTLFVQAVYFPPEPAVPAPAAEEQAALPQESVQVAETPAVESSNPEKAPFEAIVDEQQYESKEIAVETDKFHIIFDTDGAVVRSMRLKDHKSGDREVEMVLSEESDLGFFGLAFGEKLDSYMTEPFQYSADEANGTYTFTRDYRIYLANGELSAPFRIEKKFVFFPDQYLFEVRINITNYENAYIPLNFNNQAYTLSVGPQIGPDFKKLDNRNEYRRYYSVSGEDRIKHKLKGGQEEVGSHIKWAGLIGKYFTVIGIPSSGTSKTIWSNQPVNGVKEASRMFFVRSFISSSRSEDIYRFYVGPKNQKSLQVYNNSMDNPFNFSDMYMDKAVDLNPVLNWLEVILRKILEFFYNLIPNYGVAIILLTILIKAVFFPITHKSYESTGKMQSIQPQIKALQEKYKSDPTKLNKEMAELYKKEGVNPMGGCLPLLIQMPIFFALYGLLNKYFDLRGAAFIPGWINDLSAPESIWNFGSFTLPLLGWNDLRLLPILYLGTQLLMSKFTQAPTAGGQNAMQTKMLTLGMPIMFFFILYDMPSGLLVYWTVTNILTAVQQAYISKKKKRKA